MQRMDSQRSWWSRAALVAALTSVLITLAGSAVAGAGVVEVRQCRGAGNDLLDGGAPGGFLAFTDCDAGGAASLLSTGAAGASVPVGFRNMTFTAPGDTTFVGGTLYRQMHNYFWYAGSGAPSWAYGYALLDATGVALESCGFGTSFGSGECFTNTSFYTVFPTDHIDLPTYDSHSFTLTVGCGKVGACHHWWANPGIDSVGADFLVRDDVPPVVKDVSGPLATVPVIHEGDIAVTLGASDEGGLGVYDARLLVDDQVVSSETFDTNDGRCVDSDPTDAVVWMSGQPCPVLAAVREFSFGTLPEGPHNIKVQVRDAALNETLALNRNVIVDIVGPPSSNAVPVISGTPAAGHTLAVNPGQWDGHGRPVSLTYRWLRCDAAGNSCVEAGNTPAHDITDADNYHAMVAEVTATSDEGTTTTRSAPTSPVSDSQNRTTPPPPADKNVNAVPGKDPGQGTGTDSRGAANGDNPSDSARLSAVFSANRKRTLRISYGKRPVLRGKLTNASGLPISNAKIELLSRLSMRGARTVDKGGARTRKDGSWTLILPKDLSSRTLTLRYRSHMADTRPAAEATLKLSVKAGLSLSITPRSSHNHGTIHFAARVRGHSIPVNGKVVEIQARGKGHNHWITFKTVRSARDGVVRAKYTFHASSSVRYQFRARARAESGYPYLTGTSHVVTVHVR